MKGEDALQAAVVDWIRWKAPHCRVTAIPSGGHMSARMGARRKRVGAVAGVPDLLVEVPHRTNNGFPVSPARHFWIELKLPKSYPTPAQREFMARGDGMGVPSHVCRSVEEVEEAFRREGVETR